MHREKTFVLIKPDGVQRNLIGKIINRFEETGLKIIAIKMLWPSRELAEKHYPLDEEWAKGIFNKTKASYEKDNKPFLFKDHIEAGKEIQSRLIKFLTSSPVIALILEGPHAVEITRKLVGSTESRQALPGTIRGDFASVESYAIADTKQRTIYNLIHASDTKATAEKEISLWFSPNELHDYKKELDRHF